MSDHRGRSVGRAIAGLAIVAMGLAGCGEEPRVTRPGPGAQASAPPAPAKEEIKLTPIIGAKTTDVRDAQTELSKNNAQVSELKITAKDPITLQGNAYVTMIGKTSVLQIQHALDLYYAQYEKYPATLEEFKSEILTPNGIALPQLPYYQKYGYDSKEHKLIVLEYPDLKEQFQKQQDERFGRN